MRRIGNSLAARLGPCRVPAAGLLRAAFLRSALAALVLLLPTAVPVESARGEVVAPAAVSFAGDSPDPTVLKVGGTYYAYSTNSGGSLLPVLTSTDLVTWTPQRDG